MLRYYNDIWDKYHLDTSAQKLNARAPPPEDKPPEEQNAAADVQNADDSFNSGEDDDIAMRVMEESAEP